MERKAGFFVRYAVRVVLATSDRGKSSNRIEVKGAIMFSYPIVAALQTCDIGRARPPGVPTGSVAAQFGRSETKPADTSGFSTLLP